jgi:hypothetical protein
VRFTRLIHRREETTAQVEADEVRVELPPLPFEELPDQHVSTERLKRQFEERFAARKRRRGRRS